MREFEVFLAPREDTRLYAAEHRPADLLNRLDQLFEVVDATGLACIAKATALLSPKLTGANALFSTKTFPITLRPVSSAIGANLYGTLQIYITDKTGEIAVQLPKQPNLEFAVGGSHTRVHCLKDCQVTLFGKYRMDPTEQTQNTSSHRFSSADEINILTQMTFTVIEGICKEVKFDSYDEIPHLLAEGVLRTLHFPNPAMVLHKVRVMIRLPESTSLGPYRILVEKRNGRESAQAMDELGWQPGKAEIVPETTNGTAYSGHAHTQLEEAPLRSIEAETPVQRGLSTAAQNLIPDNEQTDGPPASEATSGSTLSDYGMPFSFKGGVRIERNLSPV